MTGAAFVFAAMIGLLLGALGGGGSIVTVPVLVYALGLDPKLAIATSLPIVGMTSVVGAVGHWRAGQVQAGPALSFGVLAMLGAYIGARLGVHVPAGLQLTLLGIVMLMAALSMLTSAPRGAVDAGPEPSTGTTGLSWRAGSLAFGIGTLTGLVGIGGGFLFVPVLVLLAGVPMRSAVGTSLVVIAMNATAGSVGYAGSIPIAWMFVLTFGATASAAAAVGVWVARRTPVRALQQAFGVLLLVVGSVLLFENVSWQRSATASIELARRAGICSESMRERAATYLAEYRARR